MEDVCCPAPLSPSVCPAAQSPTVAETLHPAFSGVQQYTGREAAGPRPTSSSAWPRPHGAVLSLVPLVHSHYHCWPWPNPTIGHTSFPPPASGHTPVLPFLSHSPAPFPPRPYPARSRPSMAPPRRPCRPHACACLAPVSAAMYPAAAITPIAHSVPQPPPLLQQQQQREGEGPRPPGQAPAP